MGDRGVDRLTRFAEAFRARILAQPARAPESTGNEADCGQRCGESFAKFDPVSRSWKTRQFSLLGGLEPFSETWPYWGSMQDGECYQQPMPSGLMELRAWITSESESGFSLGTPTSRDWKDGTAESCKNVSVNGLLGRQIHRMPSIRKSDAERGGRADLIQAVRGNPNKHFARMQTPTVQDASGRDRHNQKDGTVILSLLGECRRLQTPVADDAVNRKVGKYNSRGEPKLSAQAGGSLNPEWVEWFMGWPIGMTGLQPLGMDRFQAWFDSHGRR